MSVSEEELEYLARAERQLRFALGGAERTFFDIARLCKGLYPTVVSKLLEGLSGVVLGSSHECFRTIEPAPSSSSLSSLEGNPTLCSWYFTEATCERVAALRDWSDLRIAFLGTPRLYEHFARKINARRLTLLDLDRLVIEHLESTTPSSRMSDLIEYDVQTEVPEHLRSLFDCVFFDPPWYPEHYSTWLARAAQLAPNGVIMFTLFPSLTRPAAEIERVSILAELRNSARLITTISSFLEYEVPTFERAELEACDITPIEPWKVADLVLLEPARDAAVMDIPIKPFVTPSWREVDIGSLRLFIDPGRGAGTAGCLLMPLSDGSIILRSPSRRDPRRKEANVLSSRGHAAVTSRPDELVLVLKKVRDNLESGHAISEATNISAIDPESRAVLLRFLGIQ